MEGSIGRKMVAEGGAKILLPSDLPDGNLREGRKVTGVSSAIATIVIDFFCLELSGTQQRIK